MLGRKANCSYFIKYAVPPFFLLKNQNKKKAFFPLSSIVCSEFQTSVAVKIVLLYLQV